jgi:hypothetical protein
MMKNGGGMSERFYVIDERGLAVETLHAREGWFITRLAPSIFETFKQSCLFP